MSAEPPGNAERAARLRALVTDHLDFIWRLLRRSGLSPADADDATQQVFMAALSKLDRIAVGSERPFLYGTALRVASNLRRKVTRRREEPYEPAVVALDEGTAPDEGAELSRARAVADLLLAQMPPDLRRVLVLAEIEEQSAAAIAVFERIPPGTVASRLRRARAMFSELLAAHARKRGGAA